VVENCPLGQSDDTPAAASDLDAAIFDFITLIWPWSEHAGVPVRTDVREVTAERFRRHLRHARLAAQCLEPGKDMALVGFDGMPETELTFPPLSTVSLHPRSVGRNTARLLIQRIAEPERRPHRNNTGYSRVFNPQAIVFISHDRTWKLISVHYLKTGIATVDLRA
jgi:hypothetical protein